MRTLRRAVAARCWPPCWRWSRPAAAQERPVFPPTRDVAVTYQCRSSPARHAAPRSSCATRPRRTAPASRAGCPATCWSTCKAGHATIVFEQMGMMMDAPPQRRARPGVGAGERQGASPARAARPSPGCAARSGTSPARPPPARPASPPTAWCCAPAGTTARAARAASRPPRVQYGRRPRRCSPRPPDMRTAIAPGPGGRAWPAPPPRRAATVCAGSRGVRRLPAALLRRWPRCRRRRRRTARRPCPTRDVDVVYMMVQADAPGGPRVVEERMRWAAAAGKLRIDPPTPGMWMVMDTRTRRMATVRDADRSVLEIESAQAMPGPAPAAGAAFQRARHRQRGRPALHRVADRGRHRRADAGLHHRGRRAAARQRRRPGAGGGAAPQLRARRTRRCSASPRITGNSRHRRCNARRPDRSSGHDP